MSARLTTNARTAQHASMESTRTPAYVPKDSQALSAVRTSMSAFPHLVPLGVSVMTCRGDSRVIARQISPGSAASLTLMSAPWLMEAAIQPRLSPVTTPLAGSSAHASQVR